MKGIAAAALGLLALCTAAISAEPTATPATGAPAAPPAPDDASAFGAQPYFFSAALSADGQRLVAVGPGKGAAAVAFVLDLAGPNKGKITPISRTNGDQLNLTSCQWSAPDRVVCTMSGIVLVKAANVLRSEEPHV